MDVGDVWLLDSGASRHISFKREWFTDFSVTSGEYVMLGDNRECEVRGVGTVKIRKFVNNEWTSSTIEYVLYVPKLRKNLFSVGMCVARGFDVTFSENRVMISRRGEIVARALRPRGKEHPEENVCERICQQSKGNRCERVFLRAVSVWQGTSSSFSEVRST